MLQTCEFVSEILNRTATMNVLVPERGKRRYPVVYLYHGSDGNHASFPNNTDIEQLARGLELIVALPSAGETWFCNDPRPGGAAWEDHLAGEVVDCVDARFPTIATREGRGLAGFSMGGYGAMMLGMRHAARFSAVCAMAGSFAFGHALRPDRPQRSAFMQAVAPPGGKYDLWELAKRLAGGDTPMAIRFDVGVDDHLLDYNRQFHALLEGLGIGHQYEEVEGGHNWSYVDRQLTTTLKYVAEHVAPSLRRFAS